ncbi:MAG TPA: hypothetical protein VIN38_00325 [Thiobacillus sp.]
MLRTLLITTALLTTSGAALARDGHDYGRVISVEPSVSISFGTRHHDGFRVLYESGGRHYWGHSAHHPGHYFVLPPHHYVQPNYGYRDHGWSGHNRHQSRGHHYDRHEGKRGHGRGHDKHRRNNHD